LNSTGEIFDAAFTISINFAITTDI